MPATDPNPTTPTTANVEKPCRRHTTSSHHAPRIHPLSSSLSLTAIFGFGTEKEGAPGMLTVTTQAARATPEGHG